MEISLDKFQCKPVMQEVLGTEMPIPPLKTKHYVSLLKSQVIEAKILSMGLERQEPTDFELNQKAEIDKEIAFWVVQEICPEMTREFFENEMPAMAIAQIIEGTTKASGLTDEKMQAVREKFNRMAKLREIEQKKKQNESNSEEDKPKSKED